ncbi:hypothetical protein JXA88_08245 [Candidatus Fermentibacteria bacterium]|nr:hypothetical protein [Candidatus Fermentibacteria bacterium]
MRRRPWAILIILAAVASGAWADTWGLSLFGGLPVTHAKYAVSSNTVEFVDTKFGDASTLMGGTLTFMFRDPTFVGVDLSARKYELELELDGEVAGTLRMTPVLLGFTFRKVRGQAGLATHGGLGFGISLNDFEKTAYLDSLEAETPGFDVSVKTSFVMDLAFGMDYFLTRFAALSADIRWQLNAVPTKGWRGVEHLFMQSSNFQFVLGSTVWLRL